MNTLTILTVLLLILGLAGTGDYNDTQMMREAFATGGH
jgi:hypothetical protein